MDTERGGGEMKEYAGKEEKYNYIYMKISHCHSFLYANEKVLI